MFPLDADGVFQPREDVPLDTTNITTKGGDLVAIGVGDTALSQGQPFLFGAYVDASQTIGFRLPVDQEFPMYGRRSESASGWVVGTGIGLSW